VNASTFEIEVNGRIRVVTISADPRAVRDDERVHVTIDGAPMALSVARTRLGLHLLFEDGRGVDAALTERARGEWLVQLPRVGLTALVDARRHRSAGPGSAAAPGEQRITAPMPGRVVRVLVKPGDEVAERQGLVVVEAMKMENELSSPKAGRVKEVAVAEGVSIEAGRLLVIVE